MCFCSVFLCWQLYKQCSDNWNNVFTRPVNLINQNWRVLDMPKRRAEQVEESVDLDSPEEQGKVSGHWMYQLSA